MDEEHDLSIDDIRLWNVASLKDFLRKRNLKVSGRKDELVALVYAAMQHPQLSGASTSQATTADEQRQVHYKDLLKTPVGDLPDPLKLKNWESEASSLTKWPPTMSMDIANYLQSIDDVPLKKRLLSDYKEQKAYSYFTAKWMGEVEYHSIEKSDYCFLRAKCRPSQRIHDVPWNVWVAIVQKTGEVQSAFCQCFAGFSSTCNHVAALLFKVDYAWRHGLTNPACTSRECQWSAFAGKQPIEPMQIAELTWSKPQFSRQASTEVAEGINTKVRRLFSPLRSRSMEAQPSLENITKALHPAYPDASTFQYIKADDIPASVPEPSHEVEIEAVEIPPPLPSLAAEFSSVEDFMTQLPVYTTDMTSQIEFMTRGQASNERWHSYRKGRITGSTAHAVLTKGRKLAAGVCDVATTKLVKRILGELSVSPFIPALKYGREMEGEARTSYVTTRKAAHSQLKVTEGGLFVKKDQVFLAASPDGLVSCKCCGEGIIEIKCPLSVAHTAPSSSNLDFLVSNNGILSLKETHQYFSQIQMQMGVIERKWCDVYVYSRHGSVTVRVPFDEEHWQELVCRSETFFRTEIVKELVKKIP